MDKLLTIKDIAQELKLPPSTIKYWRDKYPEFLPAVNTGRYPKYRPEAIEVFKIIQEGISDNLQQQEIIDRLSAKYPLNIEQNKNSLAATTAATKQQQRNDFALELYQKDIENRQELTEAIRALVEQNKILIDELQRQRRPWWKKIFNRE